MDFSDFGPATLVARSYKITPVVSYQFFSKTAPRIFLIFGMEVRTDNVSKRTRPFSREKSGSLIIHENVPKNAENQTFLDFSQNRAQGSILIFRM